MKNYYITLWFFLFSIVFYSQNIDSYKATIDSTNNDAIKLQYLDSILKNIDQNNNEDYINYSKQYIDLAKKLAEYAKASDKTISLSEKHMGTGNFDLAEITINNFLKTDSLHLKDSTIAKLFRARGEVFYVKAGYPAAITDYQTSANLARKNKDSVLEARLYIRIGQSYSILNDFTNSVMNFQQATTLLTESKNMREILISRFEMGTLYSMNAFYEKAKEEREKLLPLLLKREDYITAAGLMLNSSADYDKQNLYEEQKKSLEQALIYLEKNTADDPRAQSQKKHLSLLIYNAYALYHLNSNNIDEALNYINKAKSYEDETFFELYKTTLQYTDARYYQETGNINRAVELAKEFLESSLKSKNKEGIIEGEKLMYKLLAQQGNYNEAYKYALNTSANKDSINNTVKVNTYLYYQKLFEIEESEKKVIQQTANIELLEKDNKTKKQLLLFSIGGLILLFSSIFLYRNRLHLKKEKKLQENFSQQLLASQEEERKRISKDLHDGLGQSLLLIKNKVALSNDDEGTKNMCNDAIEEVRSISRALHPFQLEKFGINKAIENIVQELDNSNDIFISADMDDITSILSPEKEVNLYRIVQESISNIIKHSNADAARIEIQKKSKYVHLKVKDNGKGFDFSEKHNDFKSLGLKTLKERTKFLKGTMKVDSEKNKGTTLEFVIPI